MQASAQLKELLHSINRKSYPAYKSLRGAYQFDRYILSIDHVQGEPFASPSHISVKLSHRDTGFPAEYYKDSLTRITLGDFLNRQFEQQAADVALAALHRRTDRRNEHGRQNGEAVLGGCVVTVGRRFLHVPPARLRKKASLPGFLSVSRPMAEPSTPPNWKKSSSIFFRSVFTRHFFTGILTRKR